MTNSEQVLSIISGLEDEYEVIVVIVSSMEPTPSLQYVYSILLAHEGRIEHKRAANSDLSVNYINYNKGKQQDKGNEIGQYNNQRGGQTYRGRGRGRTNNNNRLRCQIYEKVDHIASKCYFRFNANYSPSQQSNSSVIMVNTQKDITKTQAEGANTDTATVGDISDDC